ncbi:MAG: hypothetical protein V2I54_03940 [Bacteroidales bacterium]|jgi:hypothetical protein|nr:hypothetical protein [Bacteroidales bacterium]
MKKLIYLFLFVFVASTAFVACDDDDDSSTPFKTVTLGAQDNTAIGGFYSITNHNVYTLEEAFENQETIDFLCFYELTETHANYTTIASPGANIKEIFVGDYDFENWDTTKTTYLYQLEETVFTPEQFDALTETDAIIESLYDAENAKRKAKDLQVDDLYAFQTEDGTYGIFKVTAVTSGEDGSVEFKYIIKK